MYLESLSTTALIQFWSEHAEVRPHATMGDGPKVRKWWLEWYANLRPSGRKALNLNESPRPFDVRISLLFNIRFDFVCRHYTAKEGF